MNLLQMACVPELTDICPLKIDPRSPLTLDQLYGLTYAGMSSLPLVMDGIDSTLRATVTTVGWTAAAALVVPWVIVLLLLLLLLVYYQLLPIVAAVGVLVVMVALLSVACWWTRWNVDKVVDDLPNRLNDKLTANIRNHAVELAYHVIQGYGGVRCGQPSSVETVPDSFSPIYGD